MLQRIAARLITGPLAFLVGGVIDVLGYAAVAGRARVARAARRPSTISRRDSQL